MSYEEIVKKRLEDAKRRVDEKFSEYMRELEKAVDEKLRKKL